MADARLVKPLGYLGHQVHFLVQDSDNNWLCGDAPNTKNIVMFTTGNSQIWVDVLEHLVHTLALRQSSYPFIQLASINPRLCNTPCFPSVSDDGSKIGRGSILKDVKVRQETEP